MAETKYVNKNLFFIRFKTFQWHLNYKNYLEKRKNKPKSRTVAMNKKIFSFDGKIDSNPYPYTANNAYYSFNRNHIQKIKRMSWTHILGQRAETVSFMLWASNSPYFRNSYLFDRDETIKWEKWNCCCCHCSLKWNERNQMHILLLSNTRKQLRPLYLRITIDAPTKKGVDFISFNCFCAGYFIG